MARLDSAVQVKHDTFSDHGLGQYTSLSLGSLYCCLRQTSKKVLHCLSFNLRIMHYMYEPGNGASFYSHVNMRALSFMPKYFHGTYLW